MLLTIGTVVIVSTQVRILTLADHKRIANAQLVLVRDCVNGSPRYSAHANTLFHDCQSTLDRAFRSNDGRCVAPSNRISLIC